MKVDEGDEEHRGRPASFIKFSVHQRHKNVSQNKMGHRKNGTQCQGKLISFVTSSTRQVVKDASRNQTDRTIGWCQVEAVKQRH